MNKKLFMLMAVMAMFVLTATAAFAQTTNSPDLSQYTVSYSKDGDTLVITNTHVLELVDIPIQKVWADDENRDGYRPDSICVELKANGTTVYNYQLSGTTSTWTYTFEDKVKFNQGSEITYTVAENGVTCSAITYDATNCVLAGGAMNGTTCEFPTNTTPAPVPPTTPDNRADCEDAGGLWSDVTSTCEMP